MRYKDYLECDGALEKSIVIIVVLVSGGVVGSGVCVVSVGFGGAIGGA